MPGTNVTEIAPVLAGPILRKTSQDRLAIWLTARASAAVRIELLPRDNRVTFHTLEPGAPQLHHLIAGNHLHYLLVELRLDAPLPADS